MSWENYYEKTKTRQPAPLLVEALQIADGLTLSEPKTAIDFGCGAGVDIAELLRTGWHVTGYDRNSKAIEQCKAMNSAAPTERLSLVEISFEEIGWLPQTHLFYSNLSLPFCRPEALLLLWEMIKTSVLPNGLLALQLFGHDDQWVREAKVVGFDLEGVRNIFSGYDLKTASEYRGLRKTVLGPEKFTHTISLIAHRPSS